MADQARIRTAYERRVAVYSERPSAAPSTLVTTVRTAGGTTTEIEGDGWRITSDQPETAGGYGEGPAPAFFASAALGACLAQGFARVFATKGVPLNGVEIKVESDYDLRGGLDISEDVPIGFQEIRYAVEIDSDASEKEIMDALDFAEKNSFLLNTFAAPLKITRQQVNIRRSEQDATSKT